MNVDFAPLPINPDQIECFVVFTPPSETDADSRKRFLRVIAEMPPAVSVALKCLVCPARELPVEGPRPAIVILPNNSIEVRMACEKGKQYIENPASSPELNRAQLPCSESGSFDLDIKGVNYLPNLINHDSTHKHESVFAGSD